MNIPTQLEQAAIRAHARGDDWKTFWSTIAETVLARAGLLRSWPASIASWPAATWAAWCRLKTVTLVLWTLNWSK